MKREKGGRGVVSLIYAGSSTGDPELAATGPFPNTRKCFGNFLTKMLNVHKN